MMLIICDKDPKKAVQYLIEHTNKNFVFKQLLELGQLICSAGISDVYKKIPQGKELQNWIKSSDENIEWTWEFYNFLSQYCYNNIKMTPETWDKLDHINKDLCESTPLFPDSNIKNAIFRYKKGYESQYPTNSELPIDIAIEEYKKYIGWKFNTESEVECL